MEPEDGQEKAPQIPQSVLRAALIRRAVEDIHRIVQIRTAKQACSNLLQKGSVGDDLWQRFTRAESEMEAELRDVVMEVRLYPALMVSHQPLSPVSRADHQRFVQQANGLAPNWGQTIFQNANEIAANGLFQDRLNEIESKVESETEWWEKRRAAISSDFMKELDEESGKKAPSDDGILVDSGTSSRPGSSAGGKKKKGKK